MKYNRIVNRTTGKEAYYGPSTEDQLNLNQDYETLRDIGFDVVVEEVRPRDFPNLTYTRHICNLRKYGGLDGLKVAALQAKKDFDLAYC